MKVSEIVLKVLLSLVIVALVAVSSTSISPIYNFPAPEPFSGPDVFNPYEHLDTALGWKKANFHTHSKIKGPLNECKYWPEDVYKAYERLGYEIVTFSNHNVLTEHPVDSTLSWNLYEHGYGFLKYHKLVFGAGKVMHFDHLLPLLASQKQWQLDILGRDADFLQMNHPVHTVGTRKSDMRALEGYMIMEVDSCKTRMNEFWDCALSAGHYSFGLANDDLHFPDLSHCIGVRLSCLNTAGTHYDDLCEALRGGCYYAMHLPDYGHGDWDVKYAAHRNLPYVRNIGCRGGDTLFVSLSRPAKRIVARGQDARDLMVAEDTSALEYVLGADEPYARFLAFFEDGTAIYTNPFARYDAKKAPTPFREPGHSVNIALTVLWNLFLVVVTVLLLFSLQSVWAKGRRCRE